MHDTNERGRGKPGKERPWCWCEKAPLVMMTETLSESNRAASGRSVYLALCQLASDHQSDTFTASKALIAHKAGVSVKTVERLLRGFEQLDLVRVNRNDAAGAFRAPNTYTLLPMRQGDATMRHGGPTLKSDKVKESGKIKKKRMYVQHTGCEPKRIRVLICLLLQNQIYRMRSETPISEAMPLSGYRYRKSATTTEHRDEHSNTTST